MSAKKKPAPKRGASRYQAPAKKPVPGWVWMVCGLVIGGFIAFLMQLEPGRKDIQRETAESKKTASERPQPSTPATALQPAKPKYDFYTLLPESQVEVPAGAIPEEQKPSTAPVPLTPEQEAERALALLEGREPPKITQPAAMSEADKAATDKAATSAEAAKAVPSTQFFLQAGSFRNQNDADKLRAQIILLGQNVQIESGKVREETWHRVLVGPYASREQLAAAQKQLAGNGFSNLLLQQRQSR